MRHTIIPNSISPVNGKPSYLILLLDYEYWDKNYNDLHCWLCDNNIKYELNGSCLIMYKDVDVTLFDLRWG